MRELRYRWVEKHDQELTVPEWQSHNLSQPTAAVWHMPVVGWACFVPPGNNVLNCASAKWNVASVMEHPGTVMTDKSMKAKNLLCPLLCVVQLLGYFLLIPDKNNSNL